MKNESSRSFLLVLKGVTCKEKFYSQSGDMTFPFQKVVVVFCLGFLVLIFVGLVSLFWGFVLIFVFRFGSRFLKLPPDLVI